MTNKQIYINRIRALRNKIIKKADTIWLTLGPKSYARTAPEDELNHYIHLATRAVNLNNTLNCKEREDLIHIIQ